MQDNGPLVALIVFILASILFGVMGYMRHSDLQGQDPENPDKEKNSTKESEIWRISRDIAVIDQEVKDLNKKIAVKQEELRVQYDRVEVFDQQKDDYRNRYRDRLAKVLIGKGGDLEGKAIKGSKDQALQLADKVNEVKKKTENQIRADVTEVQERSSALVRELNEKKDATEVRIAEELKGFNQEVKVFRDQKRLEQSEWDEYKRQLDALTQREPERADISTEIDGHVVHADVVTNVIVIDRGTAAGVREGFRFQVFAVHAGNRKVHKAFVEVKKAYPNYSDCMVVARVVNLPRDPQSEYVAPEPEYAYSPYQEAGRKGGSQVQGLTAQPKKVVMGMNPEDPIVDGDCIQNPFYSPTKTFTFYIAGSKEIVHGQQKSAIAYQWPQIERVLKSYGAKVAAKVDLGVDYILAQKNPSDDPEYTKATSLGLPVIYEWELFRFLEQK